MSPNQRSEKDLARTTNGASQNVSRRNPPKGAKASDDRPHGGTRGDRDRTGSLRSFARSFARVQEVVPRIGWGVLSLWGLYHVYQAYKWIWPGRLAADATLSTSLDFYRRELERKRDYGRHIWRRSGLAFCFAGLALIVIPALIKALETPRLLPNAVPFFVLLVIWFVVFFSMRKRNQQKLQREIDELKALEGESRS